MDPHARKVAHDGEQARDREDGHRLAGGYEGPGAAGTTTGQPAQHEEDGERLDHRGKGRMLILPNGQKCGWSRKQ